MTTLTDGGRLSYNGLTFDVYSSSVAVTAEYDDAERALVYNRYVITVRGYLLADDGKTVDVDGEDLRTRLMRPGQHLVFRQKGIGNEFEVNGPDAKIIDVKWGPRPLGLDIQFVGDNKALGVVFRIETCIPVCRNAVYQYAPLAYNYNSDTTYDLAGYETRTVSGYLEIPMTTDRRRIPDHADRYRESITPPVPPGFRRTTSRFTPSLDKRRLDFAFVDEQIPVALPPLVADMPGTESIQSSMRRGFVEWDYRISATITPPAGVHKATTYGVFLSLLHDRVLRLRNIGFQPAQVPAGGLGAIGDVVLMGADLIRSIATRLALIQDFRVENELTGRSTGFHVAVHVVNPARVTDLIAGSGLFQPLPKTNFQVWRTSMLASAWRPRGSVNERFEPEHDAVVDLCVGQAPQGVPASATKPPQDLARVLNQRPAVLGAVGGNADGGVNPEVSWLAYDVSLELREVGHRVAVHKPMQSTDPRTPNLGQNIIADPGRAGGGRIPIPAPVPDAPDILHEVATPTCVVILRGRAARVGHEIPLPQLLRVAGCEVSAGVVRRYWPRQKRYMNAVINFLDWEVEYAVDRMPTRLPVPANPYLGITGRA